MSSFKFELGMKVADRVSGFEGFITGRAEYIAGCRQYCLLPRTPDAKELPKSEWFDEERLTIAAIPEKVTIAATPTGGPTDRDRAPMR